MSKKIGRNDPCTCGSGKKYKKCCSSNETPCQIPDDVIKQINKIIKEREDRELLYGKVRPIIHADFQGYKFVAVGNELHYGHWKTFPDFLVHYACGVLGSEWGNNEIKKPFEERHQILKWYDRMCRYQRHQVKGKDGLYSCIPNGSQAAFLHLAYDLYTLRHHTVLRQEVVRRLKNKQQFQGARYELFAAATCIRAGYDIEYENENDVNKKHPEFIATHKITGQKISVEAKSRHRPGVLDFPGEMLVGSDFKAGIGKLLSEALRKSPQYPYVIFIDLNLPPSPEIIFERPMFEEIKNTISFICGEDGKRPDEFNMIVFTNHPHHYGGENEPDPQKDVLIVYANNPKIVPEYPEAIMGIYNAILQYNNIPNFFPDQ